MMKLILITLLSILLISCGSMKKNKSTAKTEGSEQVDLQKSSGRKTNVNSFENASVKIENNGYSILVKPVNGQNSFFDFTSPEGHIFKGTTNAELNFEKKSEKKEIKTSKKTEIITEYWSKMTYKSQTTYKTVTRYIDKYKEAYPWYYILFAGFMLREILRWVWNWLKKSNWYLKLINKQ